MAKKSGNSSDSKSEAVDGKFNKGMELFIYQMTRCMMTFETLLKKHSGVCIFDLFALVFVCFVTAL